MPFKLSDHKELLGDKYDEFRVAFKDVEDRARAATTERDQFKTQARYEVPATPQEPRRARDRTRKTRLSVSQQVRPGSSARSSASTTSSSSKTASGAHTRRRTPSSRTPKSTSRRSCRRSASRATRSGRWATSCVSCSATATKATAE
jgi:hypothetical protein